MTSMNPQGRHHVPLQSTRNGTKRLFSPTARFIPSAFSHPSYQQSAGRRTNCPVLIPAERPLLPLELWPLRGALLVAVAVIVLGQSPLRLRDPEAGLGQAPVPGRNQKGLLG
ncbi:hypothetical protein TgHK011_007869 [Trichoderma gracile]|nr:hypothetical protein TgHK011_007869 [Trichoderma gracile]